MTYTNRRMRESIDTVLAGDVATEVVVTDDDLDPSIVTYQGQRCTVSDEP